LVLLLPPLRAPSRGPRSALSLHDALPIYPARYGEILRRLDEKAGFDQGFREELALEAFRHTAAYDAAIEAYFARRREGASEPGAWAGAGRRFRLEAVDGVSLRYGENPHQKGTFYRDPSYRGTSVANARQLHGMELSYCNIMDAAAALE